MERKTGTQPATFSLGSGIGFMFSITYPAFFETHEPIEPTISDARKNLDQIWTKVSILAERCACVSIAHIGLLRVHDPDRETIRRRARTQSNSVNLVMVSRQSERSSRTPIWEGAFSCF